ARLLANDASHDGGIESVRARLREHRVAPKHGIDERIATRVCFPGIPSGVDRAPAESNRPGRLTAFQQRRPRTERQGRCLDGIPLDRLVLVARFGVHAELLERIRATDSRLQWW